MRIYVYTYVEAVHPGACNLWHDSGLMDTPNAGRNFQKGPVGTQRAFIPNLILFFTPLAVIKGCVVSIWSHVMR